MAHSSDSEFRGMAYPQERFELPSPEMHPNAPYELPASTVFRYEIMGSVPETTETNQDDTT